MDVEIVRNLRKHVENEFDDFTAWSVLSPGASSHGFSHEMKPRLSFTAGSPNSAAQVVHLVAWLHRLIVVVQMEHKHRSALMYLVLWKHRHIWLKAELQLV